MLSRLSKILSASTQRGLRLASSKAKDNLTLQATGEKVYIPEKDLVQFASDCLRVAGAKDDHAQLHAKLLVTADVWGHPSHGLNRLEMYVDELKREVVNGHIRPRIDNETPAVASVNGHNAMGSVVGMYCMDLAIRKAKDMGVGWVVARNSNHFGVAGFYSEHAAKKGMMGLAFTNTSPLVAPTGSRKAAIGTNAIAVSAPGGEDHFMLDCATSTVAIGKVEVQHRKGDQVPLGWGVDKNGEPTTDPAAILDGGALSPLGGSAETAGYKGYGFGMMVELFTAVLGGALPSIDVGPWRAGRTDAAQLGQCFIAINPEKFVPGFNGRLDYLLKSIRSLPLAKGSDEILIPGDRERRYTEQAKKEGVQLLARVYDSLETLGKQLYVEVPKPTKRSDA